MSNAESDRPLDAWNRGGGEGFGTIRPQDEELHGRFPDVGESLTETWAYMFYEPKARLSAFVYLWVHPNLDLFTGGITVWQGHKAHHLQGELFDIRAYTTASGKFAGNGREWNVPNGLRVRILEPFQKIHLQYDDAARANKVDVTLTAAAPPVMRAHNKHFEQMLDASGEVLLRGQRHAIDGYACRDRSWGEPRPEDPYPMPPFDWMTGRFPSGTMWNVNALDDPALGPEWLGTYKVSPQDLLKDGWIRRDGEVLKITRCSKLTKRDPATGRPLSHVIDITDSRGRSDRIVGEVIAATPWSGWPNMVCWICCTRWECNGETGYGDTQEVQWTDYIFKHRR